MPNASDVLRPRAEGLVRYLKALNSGGMGYGDAARQQAIIEVLRERDALARVIARWDSDYSAILSPDDSDELIARYETVESIAMQCRAALRDLHDKGE